MPRSGESVGLRRPPIGATLGELVSREGTILLFALACLFVLMKFGRTYFFRHELAAYFDHLPLPTLHPYLWVSFSSIMTRMVAPLLLIVLVLREHPREFGYGWRGFGGYGRVYVALFFVMLPVLWLTAGTQAFQHKYPFWDDAGDSWRNFAIYEVRYFFIFFSGESFWRGFLCFGLFRRFGWHAVSIAMVPYVLVHFGKPPAEVLGAVVTGYALGFLALKHRTFWLGVALHFAIAFLMDFLALYRSGSLPEHW